MKIEVPLSPWDGDIADSVTPPGENATAKSVSGRKPTPFRSKKVHQVNQNSPDVRSFCLDRPPLADIGNEGSLTESTRDKMVGDLITLTPMTGQKKDTSDDGTPKIFTGGKGEGLKKAVETGVVPDLLSFDPIEVPDVRHLEETIEFLESELVKSRAPQDAMEKELRELKDFVVVLDKEKREVERMLEDEKRETQRLKDALGQAGNDVVLKNKVRSLQAMLQMVISEKETLMQFSRMERDVERREWKEDKQKIQMLEKQKDEMSGGYSQAEVDALVNENDTLVRKMRYVTKKLSAYQADLDAAAPQVGHLSRELQRWFQNI